MKPGNILQSTAQQFRRLLELAKPSVAGVTEQAANSTRLVIVINRKALSGRACFLTDRASTTLRREHRIVLL